jgi:hypothetical protein
MSRSREGRGRKGEMNLRPRRKREIENDEPQSGVLSSETDKTSQEERKPNPCGGYGSEAAINSHKEQLCHFQEFSRVWAYTPLMFSEIRRDKNKPLDHF